MNLKYIFRRCGTGESKSNTRAGIPAPKKGLTKRNGASPNGFGKNIYRKFTINIPNPLQV